MDILNEITEIIVEKTSTINSDGGKTTTVEKVSKKKRIEKSYNNSSHEVTNTHPFIRGLSHINIGVDDIDIALEFYRKLLGVKPLKIFRKFNNIGFAKSAGFLDKPEDVVVSIAFIQIPGANITLELMQYHEPVCNKTNIINSVNDVGGVRHIALQVVEIEKAFDFVRGISGIKMINESPGYKPFKIDNIKTDEFNYYDNSLELDSKKKEEECQMVGKIRYFYFIDPYGVQWEFEQGNSTT